MATASRSFRLPLADRARVERERRRRASARRERMYSASWRPQPGPQERLLEEWETYEVFYGGARGGGKTDAMLGDWLDHRRRFGRAARGVFFRVRGTDLRDTIRRAKEIFGLSGGVWSGNEEHGHGVFRWPDGSWLQFTHLRTSKDAEKYQGWSITRAYFEELTEWDKPDLIFRVCASLRSAEGATVGWRATGNPGSRGHQWVKARYVDPAPLGDVRLRDPKTGAERLFIRARLQDNQLLLAGDPAYLDRLRGAGPPALVKAWLDGDWSVVLGSFFGDVWDFDAHVLPRFKVPESWARTASFDWGYDKPWSLGLWARATGEEVPGLDRIIPRGSLVRYSEVYAVRRDSGIVVPNVGLRHSTQTIGEMIAKRCAKEPGSFKGSVADPSIFGKKRTEEGIWNELQRGAARVKDGKLPPFLPANNDRVLGWQKVLEMLRESAKERPEARGLWVIGETCPDWVRTFPYLQIDEKNPEDVDSDSEDHAADETRYMCVRPRGIASGSSSLSAVGV